MNAVLQILNSITNSSSVADSVFGATGALATSLEEDFGKYMQSFNPFLLRALNNRDDPGLCAVAIGLVSDIARALGPGVRPYCDEFMNSLLENLRVSVIDSYELCQPRLLTNDLEHRA